MEHITPEGLKQGYFCFRCGKSTNMYASGHKIGKCESRPEIVKELVKLNRV